MIPWPIAFTLLSTELGPSDASRVQCLSMCDACISFRLQHAVHNLLAAAGANASTSMPCPEFTLRWTFTQHARHTRFGDLATVVYKAYIVYRTVAPLFAGCQLWRFWQQLVAYTHVMCCSDLMSRWSVGCLWQGHVAQNHFTAVAIRSVSSITNAFNTAVRASDCRTKTTASRLAACIPVLQGTSASIARAGPCNAIHEVAIRVHTQIAAGAQPVQAWASGEISWSCVHVHCVP